MCTIWNAQFTIGTNDEFCSCGTVGHIREIRKDCSWKRASLVAPVLKNPPVNAGDIRDKDSIPGLERSSGEGNGNSLQYSRLRNLMGRGAWQATVMGVQRVRHDLVTKPPHHSSWERIVKSHLWRETDKWSHHLLQSREGWRLHILYLKFCERAFTGPWKESALGPLNLSGARENGWCLTHPWESSRPEMVALIDLHTIIVSHLRREPGPHRDCKVI